MKDKDRNFSSPETQEEVRIPEQPVTEVSDAVESRRQEPRGTRKDKKRLHAMRHAVLSRYPLEALARLGENVRRLRGTEREFRAELKPSGVLGAMWFDRFWSSYLRCLLAARAEAIAVSPIDQPAGQPRSTLSLKEAELPTLFWLDRGMTKEALSPDLLGQLALVARYDRHFSAEMYRAFAMLLVLRSSGQVGLEECVRHMLGLKKAEG